jgi:hypothetical protein
MVPVATASGKGISARLVRRVNALCPVGIRSSCRTSRWRRRALTAAAARTLVPWPRRAFLTGWSSMRVVLARPDGREHTLPTFVMEGVDVLVDGLRTA